jgi:hypothetical protein
MQWVRDEERKVCAEGWVSWSFDEERQRERKWVEVRQCERAIGLSVVCSLLFLVTMAEYLEVSR